MMFSWTNLFCFLILFYHELLMPATFSSFWSGTKSILYLYTLNIFHFFSYPLQKTAKIETFPILFQFSSICDKLSFQGFNVIGDIFQWKSLRRTSLSVITALMHNGVPGLPSSWKMQGIP